MPIVGIKQVELIVLRGPVVDLLPINGHGHGDLPRRLRTRHGEAGHAGRHRDPGGGVPDVALQIQPAIERDFDGIAHVAALQPPQHILPKKRPIHAKPQPGPAGAQPRQLGPQGAQERQACLPIVDVARPVLDPQDVCRLGQVRHDRVVAGHLPLVRVVAPRGPFDLQPGRHHDAVHIDRPGAQPQRGQQLTHDGRVEHLEAGDRAHREMPQPPTQRARGRHHAHVPEPLEDGVVRDVGHVAQAPAADGHQPDQHPHHRHHAEVAPARQVGRRTPRS